MYGGRYYLAFRKDAREAAALAPGEQVDVTLALDDQPRDVTLPDDFAAVLDADPEARAPFESLSYTNRKEYVDWLEGAKRAETRQRRLDQVASLLKAGRRTPVGSRRRHSLVHTSLLVRPTYVCVPLRRRI